MTQREFGLSHCDFHTGWALPALAAVGLSAGPVTKLGLQNVIGIGLRLRQDVGDRLK
jgi:hypothetical protein